MTDPTLFDPDSDTTKLYGGTSGHSGSEASQERAEWQDDAGITSARDNNTLKRLARAGPDGLTWRELATEASYHHGEASGTLSRLHYAGAVARLQARRNRCSVYVLPENVNGRTLSEYTPNLSKRVLVEILDDIDWKLRVGDIVGARSHIAAVRNRWNPPT